MAAEVEAHLALPDTVECLATLAGAADSHREAARLFGAARALRERMDRSGSRSMTPEHDARVATLLMHWARADFESARAEGAALSTGKRSPTPNAAAASANARPAAGHR